ncbi:MAG: 30S ribosomal protein S20 [Alphaproteobacteria bacterium]|nr:30S ribosomal protein S20 [Alphaproteobacteria bacterium]
MANHKSAEKRIRTNAKKATANTSRKSKIKTLVKKIETALLAGNAKDAEAALKTATAEIMRGASKGVMHKKTAARKISRLSNKIKSAKK